MAEPKLILNDEAMTFYRQGLRRACSEKYERAIIDYQRALDCIERPRLSGDLERGILTALGDAHWALDAHHEAVEAYELALDGMPAGEGHPYLHLRIGQFRYDIGDIPLALEHLTRAHQADPELFDFEHHRYIKFIEKARAH